MILHLLAFLLIWPFQELLLLLKTSGLYLLLWLAPLLQLIERGVHLAQQLLAFNLVLRLLNKLLLKLLAQAQECVICVDARHVIIDNCIVVWGGGTVLLQVWKGLILLNRGLNFWGPLWLSRCYIPDRGRFETRLAGCPYRWWCILQHFYRVLGLLGLLTIGLAHAQVGGTKRAQCLNGVGLEHICLPILFVYN